VNTVGKQINISVRCLQKEISNGESAVVSPILGRVRGRDSYEVCVGVAHGAESSGPEIGEGAVGLFVEALFNSSAGGEDEVISIAFCEGAGGFQSFFTEPAFDDQNPGVHGGCGSEKMGRGFDEKYANGEKSSQEKGPTFPSGDPEFLAFEKWIGFQQMNLEKKVFREIMILKSRLFCKWLDVKALWIFQNDFKVIIDDFDMILMIPKSF
jgi:hypothetical protein